MILLQFDEKYLEFGKIATKTASKNLPSHKLFLATVNLNDENIKQLKGLHHDVIIVNEIIDEKNLPRVKTRRRWGGAIGNHMREFLSCRITKIFKFVFENFPNEKTFIITGADTFINKGFSLETEMPDYENYDAFFLVGKDPQPGVVGEGAHNKYRSGVVILKNNLACKAFVNAWDNCQNLHKEIHGKKQWHWFWDQVTLRLTLEEMISRKLIKIKGLPHEKFINGSFDKNAYFWSAHFGGERGKQNALETWKKKLEFDEARSSNLTINTTNLNVVAPLE